MLSIHPSALCESETVIEHERRHKGGGIPAGGMEPFSEGVNCVGDASATVLVHAVRDRFEPGHDRGMRRQREPDARVGVLEDEAVRREAVDGRRVCLRVASAAEVVVARGVERDQHDVGRLPTTAPREQHDHDAERGSPFEHPRTVAQSSGPTTSFVLETSARTGRDASVRSHHPEAERVVAAVGVGDRCLERAATECLQLKLMRTGVSFFRSVGWNWY